MNDTYSEHFIKIDKTDLKHTGLVVKEIMNNLQSIGISGIELEVNEQRGTLFVSLYPDILQKQLTEKGKSTGRPRKKIQADKDTIRNMIELYGAERAADELGVSKKTLYRRLSE